MADKDKTVEAASAAPGEKRAASRPKLVKASESGDPSIQYLLGVRQTAHQNGNEESVAWATAELAKLGFE